jgi:hypothetical protein
VPLITRRDVLRYLGGRRFGAWLHRAACPDHGRPCTGITRGHRFVELSVHGRTAGLCW